jgi:hypothetical protein
VRCYSPSLRPAAFPPPSPPPICGRFCSRLHRYYTAVRLLASPVAASPPRLPVAAQFRHSGLGEMRSPRFRHVPFRRNGVSDHGRAVAPRMTVRNMLPSALSTASASAGLSLSRLNIPLHMIAVYASQPSSPATTQHSLEGGSLLPYPHRSFTGWTAPASPGAPITDFIRHSLADGGSSSGPPADLTKEETQTRRTPGCDGSMSTKFTGPTPQMAMTAGSPWPRTTPS